MKANFKYLWYVLCHKWFVFVAGRRLGVGYWQLIIHDYTKFSRAEWKPYVDNFYRGNPNKFPFAVEHHYDNNPHHWQFWANRLVYRIPVRYAKEMVADWMGAGRAKNGHWDIIDWYNQNRNKMQLHVETQILVENLIPGYKEASLQLYYERVGN